jgi:hypothetical protein
MLHTLQDIISMTYGCDFEFATEIPAITVLRGNIVRCKHGSLYVLDSMRNFSQALMKNVVLLVWP